ncbi:hypothetical protein TIFTF001_015948 [Ficus carica]|uniref:Acireductone dioxygenase n=1 Tax=Ficus carica TaxID=3494 RepID=A0AA88A6M2_FICCA|nr:hypothetical protein TIFTF001_015948 [Ficus carica]
MLTATETVAWAGRFLGNFLVCNGLDKPVEKKTLAPKGVCLAKFFGLDNWVVESDALNAVSAIKNPVTRAPEANVVKDIRDSLLVARSGTVCYISLLFHVGCARAACFKLVVIQPVNISDVGGWSFLVLFHTWDPREEVIQAWYMDDSDEDQRLPHHRNPKEFVSLDQLDELGVLSWRLDADIYETDPELKKIREDRGYSYMDFCEVCPEKLPNYEEKIKNFFEEHLHTDEEIRYCVAGSGYFDVRDFQDRWIRVWVKKGAMIVLPAGIYHRFTLDSDNYIKAMRLFVGDPVWTPFNRPHDHLPARKEYVKAFVEKEVGDAIDAAA